MGWDGLPIQTGTSDVPQQIVVPTQRQPNKQVHAVLIQALPSNTGRIVIGSADDIVATTPAGHITAMLPPPTTNVYPSCNAGVPTAPAGLDPKG